MKKHKFHYSKYPFDMNNVDIDKLMISNKLSFSKEGFKYFIGYKDDEKYKQLWVHGYAKSFDEPRYISFSIKDNELLNKYNKIWDKFNNSIQL